ncbi:DUF2200 domain-containing protein [Blastomonas marina]|nr:DUF2200 domain-containing protein [Blastomonas marina]
MPRMSFHTMKLAKVYPMYVAKVERKGRSAQEVERVTTWLTGYSVEQLHDLLDSDVDFETFFAQAPRLNPNRDKITGVICGYRVEEIEDPVERHVRQLDKLVDEIAKGKAMEKILRS